MRLRSSANSAASRSSSAGCCSPTGDSPALAEVRELLDTVPAGERRQARPTMAHAHLAPRARSAPRIRTAAANPRNTVCAGDVTRQTLSALARKGYGTLNYLPGVGQRRVIAEPLF